MTEINIEADEVATLPVTLVGKKYTINPPKAALAMRMAVEAKTAQDDPTRMFDVLNVWIKKAFGKDGSKTIQKRLDDENDKLDLPHIMTLMERVIEVQTDGNPTG